MGYPTTGKNTSWPGSLGDNTNYVALFKQAYADTIRLKAQEMESRLSDTCLFETLHGDPLNLDSFKQVATTTRDRGQLFGAAGTDKKYSETVTERRALTPGFHEFAELFDPRDEPALLRSIRPDSNYLMNVTAAFSRLKDSTIVAAFDGDATVDATTRTIGADGALAFDFPATGVPSGTAAEQLALVNTLPAGSIGSKATGTITGAPGLHGMTADVGAATSTLGVADLVTAREMLEQTGAITPGDPVYIAIHPAVARHLLADQTLTSYDFNALRPLMSGEVTQFMGCEFRLTNQIANNQTVNMTGSTAGVVTSSTANKGAYTYMYTRSAMVFGMAQDMTVRFDELPERGYSLQCFHSLGLGAVRMDPKKIVRIGSLN